MLTCLTLFANCNSSPRENISFIDNDNENIILLAPVDEPGQRLIINVTVTDKQTGDPIPTAEVYLYQANTNGEYHPSDPQDESTARLSGIITSDKNGKFKINTVLPGEYEEPGNRHIHIHYARAKDYEQTGGVILFEDNVNDEVRQWAAETGFGTIIEIVSVNGTLTGNLNIKLISTNGDSKK
jgi:protocatechuate 3,4-dioxygenase beta subunit